ncbi:MAG: copper chaperone PCu(A)C [Paracoccaceae bacterium]
MNWIGITARLWRNLARSSAAFALTFAASTAAAHDYSSGGLAIHHPYAFATAPTAMTGAGYVKAITNNGPDADRLIAVKSGFPRTELHESTETDGVSSMAPVEAVEIPPGATVDLAPGGVHIMFMGLGGEPFREGAKVPVTLVFEKAGEVAVELAVEARRAGQTDAMQGMAHDTTGTAP